MVKNIIQEHISKLVQELQQNRPEFYNRNPALAAYYAQENAEGLKNKIAKLVEKELIRQMVEGMEEETVKEWFNKIISKISEDIEKYSRFYSLSKEEYKELEDKVRPKLKVETLGHGWLEEGQEPPVVEPITEDEREFLECDRIGFEAYFLNWENYQEIKNNTERMKSFITGHIPFTAFTRTTPITQKILFRGQKVKSAIEEAIEKSAAYVRANLKEDFEIEDDEEVNSMIGSMEEFFKSSVKKYMTASKDAIRKHYEDKMDALIASMEEPQVSSIQSEEDIKTVFSPSPEELIALKLKYPDCFK